jgi:hypothetical protein
MNEMIIIQDKISKWKLNDLTMEGLEPNPENSNERVDVVHSHSCFAPTGKAQDSFG